MNPTNDFDPNIMQKLLQMYQKGEIPNMHPNQVNNNNQQNNMGNPQQMPMGNPQMPMGGFQQMPVGNPQMPIGGFQQMPVGNPQMPMGFQPMGVPYPNPMFMGGFQFPWGNPVNINPINPVQPPQSSNSNAEDWTLIFERKKDGQRINIQIPNDKTLLEACNRYKIKGNDMNASKFTANGKPLNENLIISQSGLNNNSVIQVESSNKPIMDFSPNADKYNLIFELKAGGQSMTIQISPDKKVIDAINSYKSKINIDGEMKFIFNGQNIDSSLNIRQAGLRNGSKILVITTKDIEGALNI